MTSSTDKNQAAQKILIVDRHNSQFTEQLKEHLRKYDSDIYMSTLAPRDISSFTVCLIINGSMRLLEKMVEHTDKKIAFIFVNAPDESVHKAIQLIQNADKNIKIIRLQNKRPSTDDIEKILWFTLTENNEQFLNLHYLDPEEEMEVTETMAKKIKKKFIKPKKIILLLLFIVFLSHLLFIPPLILSSYYLYKIQAPLESEQFEDVRKLLTKMDRSLNLSKKLYSVARPTFLIFSIAAFPENIFQLNDTGNTIVRETIPLYKQGKELTALIIKKDKTDQDIQKIEEIRPKLLPQINSLHENLSFFYQKIPNWNVTLKHKKQKIKEVVDTLEIAKKFLPHFDTIFAHKTEKKYLLLFANNMEIRPGGGFIGSFGIVTIKNYNIPAITVYDVYDADGQLSAHIPPPDPIRDYLHQPHWFLRDSAFSPDFYDNYQSATKFLEKEMGFTDFDGGILITTSAIQQILDAIGTMYLPGINETVTKDNFYLKAQLYAEKDFFPGSIQKKSFLSQVSDALMIKLEESAPPKLIPNLIQAFNEKQAVLYFDDEKLQKLINSLYWSGLTIKPTCSVPDKHCIVDFLYPVDANLGVNKANFFISRFTSLQVKIDKEGMIKNTFHMKIKNSSPNEIFPGGTYKNYMQILIPSDTDVIKITKDDTLIESFDEKNDVHKTVGFYVEIPAQKITDIAVEYSFNNGIKNGSNAYQLIVQKQTGSANYDFNLSVSLPGNIYLVNQNFSPLVKDNAILYNTTIKADKIFFLELLKE